MRRKNFIFFLMEIWLWACPLLFMSGCGRSYQKERMSTTNSIDVDFSKIENELSISEFVKSTKLLKLKFPPNEVLGRSTQACFYKDGIFILDKLQKKIYHFDLEGTFINEINKLGQGPGEYASLSSIMIREKVLYVYDKVSGKINLYSFGGSFIKSIEVKESLGTITILPDGTFVCFTPDFIYNAPLGLWKMTATGEFDKSIIEYTEKFPIVYSNWSYFYPISSKEIGIACPATNRYWRYDYERDDVVIDLEMNVKQKTASSFPGIDNNILIKEAYWTCLMFACSDNYIFGIWSEHGGRSQAVYSLYNKKTKEMKCYSKLTTSAMNFPYMGEPIVSNLPNSIITYFPEEDGRTTLCIYNMK